MGALSSLMVVVSAGAGRHADCRESKCCRDSGWVRYEKNEEWAAFRLSYTPGMNPYDVPVHRTPWSCNLLEYFSGNVPIAPLTLLENPPAGSPVAKHGRVQMRGNQMLDESGEPLRLRGMSFFWSQWMGHYWKEDLVNWLKKDWQGTLIRAAGSIEMGGHLENPGLESKKKKKKKISGLYPLFKKKKKKKKKKKS